MLSTPLQHGKYIPRGSGIINRPRLLDKLQGAWEHKLTLISAPPGYGKTTLVAQFAHQSAQLVIWQTIDERDRDVPNLFANCLTVLETVTPGINKLALPQGYASSELAAVIADYVRNTPTSGDFIYILDDLHHLAGAPAAEAWLRTLVNLVPPNCHLILISRILPDLPLVEMIARREVLAIGQEELKLTTQEIYALGMEILGFAPPITQIQALAERLEGWPAGTVLAFHPLPPDLERAALSGGQGPEALFDALAASMLQAQPPGIRDFLLASSTLTRLTPELCSAALDLPNSFELLTELQVRNLFLARVTGGLVYHTLFRNFLQQRQRVFDPELFLTLHLKAATWFEIKDQVEEAFEHYLIAGMPEQAAVIAERVSQAYFVQGKMETLLGWAEKLSETGVTVPELLYRCGIIHIDRYEYAAAEEKLAQADTGYAEVNNPPGRANVLLERAYIDLQRGEHRQAERKAMQVIDLPPGAANVPGRARSILGLASLRLGNAEGARQYFEEALPLYRSYGDAYSISQLLQSLGMAYARLGRLADSSACLQEVVALRRSLGSPGQLAPALNNLGYSYHRTSDYPQALATLQEGMNVVARAANKRAETYLLWSLGDLQRDRGGFDEALHLYHKGLELLGNSEPSLRCSLLISIAVLRRWQGKLPESILMAQEASALADKHSLSLETDLSQMALWTAYAQQGRAAQALPHLELVIANLRKQGAQYDLIQAHGLCAYVALLCSKMAEAERYLAAALTLVQQIGSAQPLAAEILRAPLLESLINRDSTKYAAIIHDLKRLREAQIKVIYNPQLHEVISASVTYHLRVLTLGPENILRDGKPVPSSEWRASAARELFFYLLFVGPQSREQISLDFWPDSSSKQVRSNFHTTLYRARQALGENVIAFIDGRYLINPEVDVYCDAHQLESLAIQARLLSPHDARTEDLWRRAVSLCKGDFLVTLDADWIIPRREALREIYLEALIGQAECARARNDIREALYILKRAQELEPYREEIHRAIMICYAAKGERQKVLMHLRELERLLRQELDVQPSNETLVLAQSLLS